MPLTDRLNVSEGKDVYYNNGTPLTGTCAGTCSPESSKDNWDGRSRVKPSLLFYAFNVLSLFRPGFSEPSVTRGGGGTSEAPPM